MLVPSNKLQLTGDRMAITRESIWTRSADAEGDTTRGVKATVVAGYQKRGKA